MAVQIQGTANERVYEVDLAGKLLREDYARFVPEIERLIAEHGKIRLLIIMRDFHGWSAGALWEDVKFDVKHFAHMDRIAIVGDRTWQRWMAQFCRPFTTARIRYFEMAAAEAARAWLSEET